MLQFSSERSQLRALAGLLCLCGCGGGFIEPNPPVLSLLQVQRPVAVRPEPILFLQIIDLEITAWESCQAVMRRLSYQDGLGNTVTFLNGSSETALQNAIDLPPIVLSGPYCSQPTARRIDVNYLRQKFAEAMRDRSGFHLRPVVLYINSSDLPLPPDLLKDLRGLIAPLPGSGLSPLLWLLTTSSVAHQIDFAHRTVPWVHALDEELIPSILRLAEDELPLWSVAPEAHRPAPLLGEEVLRAAVAFKVCRTQGLIVEGIEGSGTVPVDVESPPMARLLPPELLAQPGSAPLPAPGRAEVEICTDRCERHISLPDGAPGPTWRTSEACALLPEGPS